MVLAAALLHDIGVPRTKEAAGTSDPPCQEAAGAPLARQVLEELDLGDDAIEQVWDIVRREPAPKSWERGTRGSRTAQVGQCAPGPRSARLKPAVTGE